MNDKEVLTDAFGAVPILGDSDSGATVGDGDVQAPSTGTLPPLRVSKMSKREERRRKRRRRNLAVATVVILALIAAGAWAIDSAKTKTPPQIEPSVETVRRGDFSRSVESKGKIRPLTSSYVTSPVPGTVGTLHAVEGARVSAGDTLFVVANPELDEAVSDAKAGSSAAWGAVNDAKRMQAQAQKELNDARWIEGQAKQRLDGEQDPTFRPELEAQYEAAKQAVRGADAAVSQAAGALSQANAQAATADRAVAKAQSVAAQRVVVAPMDGVIIAVNITQGGPVTGVAPSEGGGQAAMAAAVEIADMSSMVVRVSVSERDIASVVPGQACVVTFDAIPSLEATASVMRVAPKASGAAGMPGMDMGMPGGQVVNYDVDVRIDGPDPRLLIGMTAQARIDITRQEGVLLISTGCVVFEDSTYVDVVPDPADPSVTERRVVKLGESNDDVYVVLEGLQEGEHILNHLGAMPMPSNGKGEPEMMDPAVTYEIGG